MPRRFQTGTAGRREWIVPLGCTASSGESSAGWTFRLTLLRWSFSGRAERWVKPRDRFRISVEGGMDGQCECRSWLLQTICCDDTLVCDLYSVDEEASVWQRVMELVGFHPTGLPCRTSASCPARSSASSPYALRLQSSIFIRLHWHSVSTMHT